MVAFLGAVALIQGASAKEDGAEQQAGRSVGTGLRTDKPYFKVSAEERRSFVAKLRTVKLGDSRQSVESLLGKPWSDEVGASKKTGAFLGRFVDYYLTKYFEETVNEKLDEHVMLVFDASDHLVEIVSAAAEIPSRRPRSPDPRPRP